MTTEQVELSVADAEQEAVDADALAAELEERVRQGDETVTPADIREAEELGRFARLRVEAAKRKATGRRKTAALTEASEFKARLIAEASRNDAEVVEAWLDLVEVLRRLQDASDRRWTTVDEQVRERSEVGLRVREDASVEIAELGVKPGRYGRPGYEVPDRGIDVRQVATHELLIEALTVALSGSTVSQLRKTGSEAEKLSDLPKMPRITGLLGWPEAVRDAIETRS